MLDCTHVQKKLKEREMSLSSFLSFSWLLEQHQTFTILGEIQRVIVIFKLTLSPYKCETFSIFMPKCSTESLKMH